MRENEKEKEPKEEKEKEREKCSIYNRREKGENHKREYLKEVVHHNLIREKERDWWEEILREKERKRERV